MLIMDKSEYNAFHRIKRKREEILKQLDNIVDKVDDIGVDFIIIGNERGYVIERKTLIDMMNSIHGQESKAGGRFWSQLRRVKTVAEELSNQYDIPVYPLVIIEGSTFQRYKARFAKMTPGQWFGIQTSIAEMGIGLIRTWNREETILALRKLKDRSGKEKIKVQPMAIKKELRTAREEAIHMLYAVSGVGTKRAYNLIMKYGTVKEVVNLSKDRLVSELGRKVGGHFYEVVNTDWRKEKKVV